MKKELLEILRWRGSEGADWELGIEEQNDREIRKGVVRCKRTGVSFPIENGILNMLDMKNLPPEVAHEKEHAEEFDYLITAGGEKYPINTETLERFRNIFLSLPSGDGSGIFRPGGSFDNQAGNAGRFFKTMDLLKLKGTEKVLEVGASFGWASWRFAQRGCQVVALDVTHYLMAGDLYFNEDGAYYDRVMADMSSLPFGDQTFDLIFSHSVIHHCKDLDKLFREFHRVLKPGGRVVALHECSFGLLEDKSGKALQEAIEEGFNENAYTIPQWKQGARDGGFRKVSMHFFSFVEDYLHRKKLRGAERTFKLSLAKWLVAHPRLHHFINYISIWPRIIFRPKSWMLIATK